jgi:hypothetical protein
MSTTEFTNGKPAGCVQSTDMSDTQNVAIKDSWIRDDGYISFTKMCKHGGKKPSNFTKTASAQKLVDTLSNRLGVPSSTLIRVYRGNSPNEPQGTWVHPHIATYAAQWISVSFSLDVSEWIEEWKLINYKNPNRYEESLESITPDSTVNEEKLIQDRLQKELGGETEVKTPVGYIDLLTSTEIIEIKAYACWKHALGQVYAYSTYYPSLKRRLHLFGGEPNIELEKICESLDIRVTYE